VTKVRLGEVRKVRLGEESQTGVRKVRLGKSSARVKVWSDSGVRFERKVRRGAG
jgi:hypothetical protein